MSDYRPFTPDLDEPYAQCKDCDKVLPTEADLDDHFEETRPSGGRSHTARITNPSREQRIRKEVQLRVGDAIAGAMEELWHLVGHDDLTPAEIAWALRGCPNFLEAWEEETEEGNREG